jgi:hypothetical protein
VARPELSLALELEHQAKNTQHCPATSAGDTVMDPPACFVLIWAGLLNDREM